jgi:hypothetical protein
MNAPFTHSINVSDPAASKRIPLLRVPDDHNYTIEKCYVAPDTTQAGAAGTYWELSLENGGTSGTAQTLISGTAGGTPGWTANTPQEVAVTAGSGKLTAGQWLNANYAETGAPAPGRFTINLEVRDGIGSKANA